MINGNKVLLVMGGFAQVCDIVENARSKNIYVIVTDYLKDSPAKKIADESHMVSITDINGMVELCKSRNVDGIMNYCIDPGQKPYQQICEKLGLPCYGTKEQFDIMTNKDLFKNECVKNGLDIIPSYKIEDFSEPDKKNKIEYPVVIKPADGRASKGTTLCHSKSEIKRAIDIAMSFSQREKVVIEKFMTGQEVVIKYFVCDGEISFTSMADLYTCYRKNGERAYIGTQIFPSKHYPKFKTEVDSKVRNLIKNIGIKNGPMSFDGFFDGEKFRFFDPSFRMGGAQDWRIVEAISGVNISDLLTNFALTGKMGDCQSIRVVDNKFIEKASAMLYFLVREGQIKKIRGLNEALKVKSVIGYHMSHNEGDIVSQRGTSDHVVIRFLLVSNNNKRLKDDILKIQKLFSVIDDKGDDMLLPNFNVNLI
jgi:biotin carboxylase